LDLYAGSGAKMILQVRSIPAQLNVYFYDEAYGLIIK